MTQHFTTTLTVNELSELITAAVSNAVTLQLTLKAETEPVNRQELKIRLKVTEPTIIRWERKDLIPSFRIGSAVRYNWSKVFEIASTTAKRDKKKKNCKRRKPKKVNWQKIIDLIIVIARLVIAFYHL
jgi:hypothetical protein